MTSLNSKNPEKVTLEGVRAIFRDETTKFYLGSWLKLIFGENDLARLEAYLEGPLTLIENYISFFSSIFEPNINFQSDSDKFLVFLERRSVSKDSGTFFTPDSLIDGILSLVLPEANSGGENTALFNKLRIYDPAMGTGRFFLRILNRNLKPAAKLLKNARRQLEQTVSSSLFGHDLDSHLIRIARVKIFFLDLYIASHNQDWSPTSISFDNWNVEDALVDSTQLGNETHQSIPLQYDVILGNPPYRKIGKSPYRHHPLFRQVRGRKSNVLNLSALFVRHAVSRIREGGILSFIVPKGLAYNNAWEVIRNIILERSLTAIIDCRKAFHKVLLEQMIFVTRNRIHRQEDETSVYSYSAVNSGIQLLGTIKQQQFLVYSHRLFFEVRPWGIELLQHVYERSIPLREITRWGSDSMAIQGSLHIFMGNSTGFEIRSEAKEFKEKSSDVAVLWGKNVQKFVIKPRYIPNDHEVIPANYNMRYNTPHLVVQRIVAHIRNHIKVTAAFDYIGCLSLNTVTNAVFRGDKAVQQRFNNDWICDSYQYLVFVLNAPLTSFLVHKFLFSDAIRSMDFSASVLGDVRIPMLSQIQQRHLVDESVPLEQRETEFCGYIGLTDTDNNLLKDYILS